MFSAWVSENVESIRKGKGESYNHFGEKWQETNHLVLSQEELEAVEEYPRPDVQKYSEAPDLDFAVLTTGDGREAEVAQE